jgi:hypothetical protein
LFKPIIYHLIYDKEIYWKRMIDKELEKLTKNKHLGCKKWSILKLRSLLWKKK